MLPLCRLRNYLFQLLDAKRTLCINTPVLVQNTDCGLTRIVSCPNLLPLTIFRVKPLTVSDLHDLPKPVPSIAGKGFRRYSKDVSRPLAIQSWTHTDRYLRARQKILVAESSYSLVVY